MKENNNKHFIISLFIVTIFSFLLSTLFKLYYDYHNSGIITYNFFTLSEIIYSTKIIHYLIFILLVAGYISAIALLITNNKYYKRAYFLTSFANFLFFFVIILFIRTDQFLNNDSTNIRYGFAYYWMFSHVIILASINYYIYKVRN